MNNHEELGNQIDKIRTQLQHMIQRMMAAFPDADGLTPHERMLRKMAADEELLDKASPEDRKAYNLWALRQNVLAEMNNRYFTDEERLRANHTVHECECERQLGKWSMRVGLERHYRSEGVVSLDFADGSSMLLPVAA